MLRKKSRETDLVHILKEYWWVLLFISFTFSGFMYAAGSQHKVAKDISVKIKSLQEQRIKALDEKDYLLQKIHSKDDPNFIMMTLIRVLGVTPKGQQKVVFDRVE
ncbi:MAG: hypothetical protein SP4CHLAM5_09340 [Chlamydiia bacterium]|nr:hypothetical protein [Chlamydiia bacterium]MCH9618793.1 hypothetical protein [Chlamydiia bacterium]MCH9624614.1 hypothetical protein [Chlamydiia bacterium]